MRRAILMALGIAALVSSAAAIGLGATGSDATAAIGREHYAAARAGLENAIASAVTQCESLRDAAARELCRAELAAHQVLRTAELDQAYKRTRDSARAAQRARIEARYQVERAKCAAVGGAKKDACLVNAHSARGRALLEAASPYADVRG
jgi:hypothetical protein